MSVAVSGARKPIRTLPEPSRPISSSVGVRDPEDDVGAPGVADLGAGLGVLLVGMAGLDAGAGFDDDVEALADQRLDGVGDQRDAPLPLSRLFRDA